MTSRTVRSRPRAAPGGDGLLARYREALRGLAHAWRRPVDLERSENRRVLASFGTLTLLAVIVGAGVSWDVELARWAAGLPTEITGFFGRLTHLGASGYIFALTALAVLAGVGLRGVGLGRRRDAALAVLAARGFYLFTVAAVSGIASQALKHLFGRARPKLIDMVGYLHFDPFTFNVTFASFPSGHAVTAFAMAVGLCYFMPRLFLPLLALAGLVAASRVIIGSHYLSDVLFGAALGTASAVLVRRAFAARGIAFHAPTRTIRTRGWRVIARAIARRGARAS